MPSVATRTKPYTLEALRLSRRIATQVDAAQLMGIHPNTYRNWESGKYKPDSIDKLRRLCFVFRITMDEAVEILGITPDESDLVPDRVDLLTRAGVENILNWLRGRNPSVVNAIYLAKACGLTLDEFCVKLGESGTS
jgi:DNA-binding XRE family transcriptional regulator